MTGVAHLSTALLVKARCRQAPLLLLLVAAEASDLIWVVLTLAHGGGETALETVRAGQPFQYIGDLHILDQPYSHSLLGTAVVGALLAGMAYLALRSRAVFVAVLAVALGHWLLDYLVHDADMTLLGSSTVVGPALNMDPTQPAKGLSATWPLGSWGLQTLVVAACGYAFLRAYPLASRGRTWIFVGLLTVLSLLALPLFIHGAATAMVTGTRGLVLGTLLEIVLVGAVLFGVVMRVTHPRATHPEMRERLLHVPDVLAERVRGWKRAAGGLCLLLSVVYLAQGMAAETGPELARYSTLLAAIYLVLGLGLVGSWLPNLWGAIFVPLVVAPLLRILIEPGSFGLAITGIEALLAILAVYLVYRLRTSDVML